MSQPPENLGPTLGVIVCCRDEALVIARRLTNLALSHWPESDRPHRVIVVDDHSSDATAKLATGCMHEVRANGVEFEVLNSDGRPGKSASIQAGLRKLGSSVDVIVLTDADVVNAPDALLELVKQFSSVHGLGMVCGS